MKNLKIPSESWVVVCDGQKALFLQNEGDSELLNLKPVEILAESHARTSELGTDRPGRSFQSQGHSRSAAEATDLHAQAEADFLHKIAQLIDAAAREGKTKHLVLVAPPKALGLIRGWLTPAAQAIVKAEIHKDLAHLTVGAIEEHLAAD